jgi:hypothetical protein
MSYWRNSIATYARELNVEELRKELTLIERFQNAYNRKSGKSD